MWQSVCEHLKQKLGDEVFRNWIASLVLVDAGEECVKIAAPTAFMCDWVRTHFSEVLLEGCRAIKPSVRAVEIILAPTAAGEPEGAHMAEASKEVHEHVQGLGMILDKRLTFHSFVVGKPNEFAHAAARRVAESSGVSFNPLFLYGGVGLGKTHLMHAIAHHIREIDPKRSVLYLSAEKFMYHFIKALRSKDTVSFKDRFRSVDVLMIDDIQFISGKESTQEEFFHTFNALIDQKHQVVLSADKSPSDLAGIEERVRSRLGWGLVADIHPATYELRLGILEAKAEKEGGVPHEVLEFLAQKITSNIRELEGALTRVMAHAHLVGRKMTLELANEVLGDVLRACRRVLTVEDIQQHAANYYNVRFRDLQSPKRTKVLAMVRQVAMFLVKELTNTSLPDIGRAFGNRDHTTVLHGVRKVQRLLQSDMKVREDVDLLRRMLQS